MKVHVLQHVLFEDIGALRDQFSDSDELSYTRFFLSEELPSVHAYDLLVVMGGPMSVNDTDEYAWLESELAFIRSAVSAGKMIIGICLGAQLIAKALGSAVYPNGEKEIGWFQIDRVSEEDSALPQQVTVCHWHGETFDIPSGARHLYSSACCRNQSFSYGELVYALQFHPEMNETTIAAMLNNCADELIGGRYVQSAQLLIDGLNVHKNECRNLIETILRRMREEYKKRQ